MTYLERIRAGRTDPEVLEQTYRSAVERGEGDAFAGALEEAHAGEPGSLLFGAWHHRLAYDLVRPARRAVPWLAAIALAVANGLVFWLLSADQFTVEVGGLESLPLLAMVWAPISAVFVMAFLVVGGARDLRSAALVSVAAVGLGLYPLWAHTLIGDPDLALQYVVLAVLHLAVLAWSATGLFLLRDRADAPNRFAFLAKSLEVFVMAGLFVIAGGIFTAITIGLFEALSVTLPEAAIRLIVAGGAGLIPVLAVAVVYDTSAAPADQPLDEGLGRVIATLMRALLPLTLLVLAIYVVLIPLRFWEAFQDRDVLIIYNVMVFAVIALLVGATPFSPESVSPAMRGWLRRGLIVLALLAVIVSVYELAAIAYRTWDGGLTFNRLTILGWNLINTTILVGLLVRQRRAGNGGWLPAMKAGFAAGMPLYAGWALLIVLVMPWLFR